MEKLFKLMQKVIYPAIITLIGVTYFLKSLGRTEDGILLMWILCLPVPLIISAIGFIGLFVLRIKEAHAERKSGVKQIQTQDKEE